MFPMITKTRVYVIFVSVAFVVFAAVVIDHDIIVIRSMARDVV